MVTKASRLKLRIVRNILIALLLLCPGLVNAECITPIVRYYGFNYQEIKDDRLIISFERSIDGLTYDSGRLSFLTVDGEEGYKYIGKNDLLLWNFELTDQYQKIGVHTSYSDGACSMISLSQHFQDEIASLGLKNILIRWKY